jgi:hypothetical protein
LQKGNVIAKPEGQLFLKPSGIVVLTLPDSFEATRVGVIEFRLSVAERRGEQASEQLGRVRNGAVTCDDPHDTSCQTGNTRDRRRSAHSLMRISPGRAGYESATAEAALDTRHSCRLAVNFRFAGTFSKGRTTTTFDAQSNYYRGYYPLGNIRIASCKPSVNLLYEVNNYEKKGIWF